MIGCHQSLFVFYDHGMKIGQIDKKQLFYMISEIIESSLAFGFGFVVAEKS